MATLSAGTRLGPYEVAGLIGAGGMGEVYRARDTRLDRTVALKVLPGDLATNPVRRSRFEREARIISTLNHPHICTLHDVGDADGQAFLVMEHLVGETLAERLQKGRLPLVQALTIATEIADALAAAHRRGIIHRDLKPGNVMLTKAGAKLLDFGLAKLTGPDEQPPAGQPASATWSMPLTGERVIVGTLQYMAPEQVEGKPTDARTDLWALGAMLYEMVSGKPAFEGASAASLISAILEREPAGLATLQPLTPPSLDRLVSRCLAKVPDDRWDSAHDVADELQWIAQGTEHVTALGADMAATIVSGRWPYRRSWLFGTVLALVGVGIGVLTMRELRPSAPRAPLARVSLDVRPAEELNSGGVPTIDLPTPGGSRTSLTWTPDGQALVFVGRRGGVQQLYVRRLDAIQARPLANTEGAQVPAVSADGQFVAFWASGAIKKVALSGGPAMDLMSGVALPPWGLTWDQQGRVFFGGADRPIWMIPAEGVPAAVTTVGETERCHAHPWPLSGGQALLYTVRTRHWSWGDEEVVAQMLATGARKVLLKDAADARYVSTGHLVFLRRGVLFGVPFDAARLQVNGSETALLDGVAQALSGGNGGNVTGAGQIAIAPTGTLAWVADPAGGALIREGALVIVDHRGRVSSLPAPLRSYALGPRLSPDGRRLAAIIGTVTGFELWIYDLTRGTFTVRVTEGEVSWPTWSPDGQRLVFHWLSGGRRSLAAQATDDATAPRRLAVGLLVPSSWPSSRPSSWPRDRQQLVAVRDYSEIVRVTIEDDKASVQSLTQLSGHNAWPEVSPDGRWLAYGSDVSSRNEVYVQPYPGPGPTEMVSVEGGESPAWHPSGHELFFVSLPDPSGQRRMMTVDFAPGSKPRIGRPQALFAFDPRDVVLACAPVRCYDVAPDGQRFYAVQRRTPPRAPVVTHINLVQNWFEELKAKVPVR